MFEVKFLVLMTVLTIVLTEAMLSSKNKTRKNLFKKVIFWIVAIVFLLWNCILIETCFEIFSETRMVLLLMSPLFMVPVRILFELVLIGLNIEKNLSSKNNQSERQNNSSNYSSDLQSNWSNYSSNTQNNN